MTARVHEFFAIVAPGLTEVCAAELAGLGLAEPPRVVPGGVIFSGKLSDLYRASLWVSTASRILMRVTDFTARDFGALERAAGEIPWELYLPQEGAVAFRVACRASRLYHRDAVAERFARALSGRLATAWPVEDAGGAEEEEDDPAVQSIFVRAVDDRFTVSLDASGELLHKRGGEGLSGKAPLRETLAAGILRLSGYDGSGPLVDPLCGSGNFSLEAAFLAKNAPCGWNRDFAFFRWPAFSRPQWEHLRKTAREGFRELSEPSVFASDADPAACAELKKRLAGFNLSDAVYVQDADFFSVDPGRLSREKGVVVMNPPYGLRMGSVDAAGRFFFEAAERLEKAWRGWRLGLISPHEEWIRQADLFHRMAKRRLFHGGLKVTLVTGTIP